MSIKQQNIIYTQFLQVQQEETGFPVCTVEKAKSHLVTGASGWSNLRHLDVRETEDAVAARSRSLIIFNFSDDCHMAKTISTTTITSSLPLPPSPVHYHYHHHQFTSATTIISSPPLPQSLPPSPVHHHYHHHHQFTYSIRPGNGGPILVLALDKFVSYLLT